MSETSSPDTSDAGVVAGISDGAYTLVVADFADTESAMRAYEDLQSVEDGRTVAIEGVIVVRRDEAGELDIQEATDHSTRSGFRWGLVGGIALGVIFPPSVLGSAAMLGGAGAVTGKLRQRHHRAELAQALEDAIEPGHSGIVALVSDPRAVRIRTALAQADAIVEHAIDKVAAEDIRAAADEQAADEQAVEQADDQADDQAVDKDEA